MFENLQRFKEQNVILQAWSLHCGRVLLKQPLSTDRYAVFYPETISSTPRELCHSRNLTKFAATPTSRIEILSPRT